MVLDLNLIMQQGRPDGTVAETPQRKIYSLCDGIVGGQGDGPLHPDPLPLGVVAFSDDNYLMDLAAAHLMCLAIENIPLLLQAKSLAAKSFDLVLNGHPSGWSDLDKIGIPVNMPPGWVHYR